MLRRGLHIAGRSLPNAAILVLLSGIALVIFISQKKMNSKTGLQIFDIIRAAGFNEVLTTFVLSQAAHETAGFTSSVYRNHNNAFGMKKPDLTDYQTYDTIEKSVQDFAGWYTRHRNSIFSLPLTINSLKDYVRFLKNNNYFEDTEANYLAGCQRYYNLYFA